MSDILILQVVVIVCGTVGFAASLGFLRRYLELRQAQRIPPPIDELTARLERIEHTVESTAIEVERLSEAHRFLSKLLADRSTLPLPPSSPTPIITPH